MSLFFEHVDLAQNYIRGHCYTVYKYTCIISACVHCRNGRYRGSSSRRRLAVMSDANGGHPSLVIPKWSAAHYKAGV